MSITAILGWAAVIVGLCAVPSMIWGILRYTMRRPDPVLSFRQRNGLRVGISQRPIKLRLLGPRQPISELRIIYAVREWNLPPGITPRAAAPAHFRDLLEPNKPTTTTVSISTQTTVEFALLVYEHGEPRVPVGTVAYAPLAVGSYVCDLEMQWHGGSRMVTRGFTVPVEGTAYWATE